MKQDEPKPKVHYDEVDVAACLARVTFDGKGEREPNPSNWVGYAMDDAVKEDES